MRAFFRTITTLALRLKWLTVAVTIAVIAAGVWAFSSFNQELLPSIEFPQTFILVQNGGASSDQILTMYAIPIEESTQGINDVVNVETVSNDGFGFATVRNEFGVDQSRVLDDIRAELDELQFPVRTVIAEDTSPEAMIGELSPEAMLWLYNWAQQEDNGFISQLNTETLAAFSPAALGALPPEAYAELAADIREDILPPERTETELEESFDYTTVPAPVLPDSWQNDPRFETVEDLVEITGSRNLAGIFNDFMEDERIIGHLSMVSDLTPEDVALFLSFEEACRAIERPDETNVEESCSFTDDLDASAVLAMSPDVLAAMPDDFLQDLSIIDRNEVAAVLVAESISGESHERADAPLPDAWQVEAPEIITFNFSDFPLGAISVDSDQMTADELRDFVENEMSPQLREVELVARVTLDGGEIIPLAVLNDARENLGLEPITDTDSDMVNEEADNTETTEEQTAEAEDTEVVEADEEDATVDFPEGPALPEEWVVFAAIVGAEEFDSADDIFAIVGQDVQGLEISSAAGFINLLQEQPTAAALYDTLEREVLDYLAQNEAGFVENLNLAVIQQFYGVPLGETWRALGDNPLLGDTSLTTTTDLIAAGEVETIGTIIEYTNQQNLQTYAIQLMNELSPEAIATLQAENGDFLSDLAQQYPDALRYLSREALSVDPLASFIADELGDETLQNELQAIIDGEPTAAETFLASTEEELFVDPNAPTLPASWADVAPFVGADELDTTDDIFNVPNYESAIDLVNRFATGQGQNLIADLTTENWVYLGEQEPTFWGNINATALRLIDQEMVDMEQLPNDIQTRIAAGGDPYEPEDTITRTDQNPSLVVQIFKDDAANTVEAWDNVSVVLDELNERDDITVTTIFEQATFITTSLEGVQREGSTGAVMAIVMILIFMNVSLRSTAVVSVSIPGSVFGAMLLLYFVPGNLNEFVLTPLLDSVGRDGALGSLLVVVIRLFPADFTLNIMTLSGLTVAIGRVVDDSIVVLENIYRNITEISPAEDTPNNKTEAAINGANEVSVAIFSATLTTMVVFIPLGLFGGVTGAFFLPFGLTVAYSLVGSYLVSITTVPVLAYLFISRDSIPEDGTRDITNEMSIFQKGWASFANVFIGGMIWLSHQYSIAIKWALRNRWVVIGGALASLVFGLYLFGQRPVQFLPSFGEPTITTTVSLPSEFNGQAITIAQTDAKVSQFEEWLFEQQEAGAGIVSVQVTIGSAGAFGDPGAGASINEQNASLSIVMESQEALDALLDDAREQAELIFDDIDNNGVKDYEESGEDTTFVNSNVTVSGAAQDGGGFGGFALVLQGEEDAEEQPTLNDLAAYNETVLTALNNIDGLVNVELDSPLSGESTSYVRIDGVPALRYIGEIESDDTIGVTQQAVLDVQDAIDEQYEADDTLTIPVEIGQGFDSEQQQEGIAEIFFSMIIATAIAYLILVVTFGNPILPIEILVSLPLAIVGAAIGLTVTDRVLGLPALVGLLMLIGIVVTNAIVFLDRVQQNRREFGLGRDDALVEAGKTRLRPILMTAATTTIAQLPLAMSTESGAIIAAELGTVVIGGLLSSTFLTLFVLPVVYSLMDPITPFLSRLILRRGTQNSNS